MRNPLETEGSALTPKLAAPQHKPRPLPLFLAMLRSETAAQPDRMAQALKGVRAYQDARRPDPQPLKPVLAERQGVTIRDYGGDGRPVLFVPSLINPPNVLDLGEERSLLRWLASHGHRVLLVDWGWDALARRDLSVGGHVAEILVPLIELLERPPALAGYCLGGTMAIAAATLTVVPRVATIAAPWHFSGVEVESRAALARLWAGAEPMTRKMGLLPMEILQSAFWSLDPARSVSKFETFAGLDPGSPEAEAFVMLEDWANDGPPLTEAAARELFEDFYAADVTGNKKWTIKDCRIDPDALRVPLLNIVSTTDRIVPHASAIISGERIELALGHVGMVVGARAREAMWRPLGDWLAADN